VIRLSRPVPWFIIKSGIFLIVSIVSASRAGVRLRLAIFFIYRMFFLYILFASISAFGFLARVCLVRLTFFVISLTASEADVDDGLVCTGFVILFFLVDDSHASFFDFLRSFALEEQSSALEFSDPLFFDFSLILDLR
jgi:hypothetical protein